MLTINKYSKMVREIALTDLKLKYQGSVLGYLWSLVKRIPLMNGKTIKFKYNFCIMS